MKIDKPLILKLENLARLQLSPSERENMESDLNKMLSMVSKMDELDLDHVKPLIHLTDNVNALRPDEITEQTDRVDALKNAPKHDDKGFLVPKVI
jgi:aspartyl/glutamyl-tRNA(Asn/Gln) amidotransferase, C subunit